MFKWTYIEPLQFPVFWKLSRSHNCWFIWDLLLKKSKRRSTSSNDYRTIEMPGVWLKIPKPIGIQRWSVICGHLMDNHFIPSSVKLHPIAFKHQRGTSKCWPRNDEIAVWPQTIFHLCRICRACVTRLRVHKRSTEGIGLVELVSTIPRFCCTISSLTTG